MDPYIDTGKTASINCIHLLLCRAFKSSQ